MLNEIFNQGEPPKVEDNQAIFANIEYLVPPNGLKEKVEMAKKKGRPLIVKLGFDPTAPDLHLGHAVVLRKLRQFQDAGHQIVVIIGDFTARIGDPTGRNTARPPLSEEAVKANAETYISQLSKVLDVSKISVRYNSSWLNGMGFSDVVALMSSFTLAQMMQREDFSARYNNGTPIHMHELLYPLMQGHDSVVIKADIEIGGTDQLFNCQVGRALQGAVGTEEQIVISMPLLVGLDGKEKMSKSKNNYIGLTEAPNQMYGKAMSIPDDLLSNYLDLVTSFSKEDIDAIKAQLVAGTVNPMNVKKQIAFDIVHQYHGEAEAKEAELYFYNQFQSKENKSKSFAPVSASSVFGEAAELGIVEVCHIIKPELSKSEIRRLISSNAVRIDGEKISDAKMMVSRPAFDRPIELQVGKMGYYSIAD